VLLYCTTVPVRAGDGGGDEFGRYCRQSRKTKLLGRGTIGAEFKSWREISRRELKFRSVDGWSGNE
jgi:hypothetical protein